MKLHFADKIASASAKRDASIARLGLDLAEQNNALDALYRSSIDVDGDDDDESPAPPQATATAPASTPHTIAADVGPLADDVEHDHEGS